MFAGMRFKLYWSSVSALFEIGFMVLLLNASVLFSQPPYQRFVRRLELPEMGIPNPRALAYSPLANALLVAPSLDAHSLYLVTLNPDINSILELAAPIKQPINMTFDPRSNNLFFLDVITSELVGIRADERGRPINSPDAMVRLESGPFNAATARGMSVDPVTGDLYILTDSGVSGEFRIFKISPNIEKQLDIISDVHNTEISVIPLNSLRPRKLRGIAFNPGDGHLYVSSPQEYLLFELNLKGELQSTRDLSLIKDINPSELSDIQNMVFAPSGDRTDDDTIHNLYIVDGGGKSVHGRGDIFEIALTKPDQLELRTLQINDVMMLEGDDQTMNAVFTVTLSGSGDQIISVDYMTFEGSASTQDYEINFGTLYFSGEQNQQQISVEIIGDTVKEPNETFSVQLMNARGFVLITDGIGIGTIIDNDSELLNVPAEYATIQEAIDIASVGDTILIAPGTYVESLVLESKSITLASWFLTTGESSYIYETIIDGGDANAVILIEKTVDPSTSINGLTIQNGDDGISAFAKFTISDCIITGCRDGIDYERGSGGWCKSSTFEFNKDDGIDLDRDVDIVIENNKIRFNDDDGIEIRMQPYTGPVLNVIIRNNIIHNNDEDGIQIIDYPELSDRFLLFERNLIYENRFVGLGCMGDGNTREDFSSASIPEKIYLFNNTFVANTFGVTGGDSLVALNNIFTDHLAIALKHVDGGSVAAYNLFWNNALDSRYSSVDPQTSYISDPFFTPEFALSKNSPAIDAGCSTYIWQNKSVLDMPQEDYVGHSPDLGAFEYSGYRTLTGIEDVPLATGFELFQNHPNPFNKTTRISFELPFDDMVNLRIYDINGRQVQTLLDAFQLSGLHTVEFDATHLSSGIYFFSIQTTQGLSATKRLLYLK